MGKKYLTVRKEVPDLIGVMVIHVVLRLNIATNINGLINNVSKQALHRAENLPAGMQQRIIIDVRGQIVTPNQERTIIKGIVERSNGVIAPTSIRFKR